MEAQNRPLLMVKNTFLEVKQPLDEASRRKSTSCPIAAFVGGCGGDYNDIETIPGTLTPSSDIGLSDLSAAARVFSTGEISRAAMEAAGHVATRRPSDPALLAASLPAEPLCNTRPFPPPLLCEPDLPEAPQWSPKVPSVSGPMHGRPVPQTLQSPGPSTLTRPLANTPLLVSPASTVQASSWPAQSAQQFGAPVRSEALFRVCYRGG